MIINFHSFVKSALEKSALKLVTVDFTVCGCLLRVAVSKLQPADQTQRLLFPSTQ